MGEEERLRRFNAVALPQLDAAFNLARWLLRNDSDAEDVVQDAYLRAFRYFDGYRGGDPRAWMLRIVRHAAFTFIERNRPAELLPEDAIDEREPAAEVTPQADPEALLLQRRDVERLDALLALLPPRLREVVVLRELEELSYKEIADVLEVPIGTVMSRLNRARQRLQRSWREAGAGRRAS